MQLMVNLKTVEHSCFCVFIAYVNVNTNQFNKILHLFPQSLHIYGVLMIFRFREVDRWTTPVCVFLTNMGQKQGNSLDYCV